MPKESWDSRMQYLREDLEHLHDPRAKTPDLALLTIGPHGPFQGLRVTPDPDLGRPSIGIREKATDRKERFASGPVFLMMDLLLAYGGGWSPNDTGEGLAYPKLFSDREGIALLRLITDAGPDEIAKQHAPDGRVPDYHNFQHDLCCKASAATERAKGHRVRSPRRGREDAIRAALRYFQNNHHLAAFKITKAEYEAALRSAFALLDAYRGAVAASS